MFFEKKHNYFMDNTLNMCNNFYIYIIYLNIKFLILFQIILLIKIYLKNNVSIFYFLNYIFFIT